LAAYGQESDLERARIRLAMLEGLLKALDNWEEVSSRIQASADRGSAVEILGEPPLSLTDIQARMVLDMPQSRRTLEGRRQIEEELERVRAKLSQGLEDT
jgi:DNA gyrase/topoisomerase IV subunit A